MPDLPLHLPTADDVARLPAEQLPALLAGLAALQGAVAARLVAAPSTNGNGEHADRDEMLTCEQAARRTGMSRRWLYQQARDGALPFALRVGVGSVRFSAAGLVRWKAQRKKQQRRRSAL